MTLYQLYKESPGKLQLVRLGAVELFEDDQIVLKTMNDDGKLYEVGTLMVGVDL